MWNNQDMFGLLSITSTLSSDLVGMVMVMVRHHVQLEQLETHSQWKHLRNKSRVKRETNFGDRSSRKTVKARHVSVTAYHDLSIKCSISIVLRVPKNIFLANFPARMTNTWIDSMTRNE